jgi:hypothetical protein
MTRPLGKPATPQQVKNAVTDLLKALNEVPIPPWVQRKIDRVIDVWPDVEPPPPDRQRPE